MTQTEEGLLRFWGHLDRLRVKMDAVDDDRSDAPRLSSRWRDEQQPAGQRLYELASTSLHQGYDCLHVVQLLHARGEGALPALTLVRTTLESAFWAEWLLEPGSSEGRRVRGLIAARDDLREWRKWADEHFKTSTAESAAAKAQIDARHAALLATFRSEAAQIGVPWEEIDHRTKIPNVTEELRKLACAQPHDPDVLVGTWRGLSGLQHGKLYATDYFADRGKVTVDGPDVLVLDDEKFLSSATAASWLLSRAVETYLRRSTS